VTDNKALSYQEKKLHQIARAPFVSFEAKLVKLGDKLHNLRDLLRTTPEGWTEQRVLAYFHWAAQVVQGILGTNAALEEQIRQVLAVRGVILPEELPAFFLPVSSLPVPPSGPS
jgi:guanosine-3',5'-bis(diphosphate) 3'-pyrophosphohydrolase